MTRFAIAAGSASVAALMLAACSFPHHRHWDDSALRTITSLDCPDSQGDLTRKNVASDGKSCGYGDDDGDEVTLQLVDVTGGDPKPALAPIEAQLRSDMAAATGPKGVAKSSAGAVSGDDDRVDIDLPGIHIHANGHDHGDGNSDHASVQINGVGVDKSTTTTTDQNNHVTVSATKPGVSVNAGDNGAEISVNEPGSGIRRTFVLTSDNPGPNGYRMVGFEARGPSSGPIVVATMKTKSDDHDSLSSDVRKLLRRNVGGRAFGD